MYYWHLLTNGDYQGLNRDLRSPTAPFCQAANKPWAAVCLGLIIAEKREVTSRDVPWRPWVLSRPSVSKIIQFWPRGVWWDLWPTRFANRNLNLRMRSPAETGIETALELAPNLWNLIIKSSNDSKWFSEPTLRRAKPTPQWTRKRAGRKSSHKLVVWYFWCFAQKRCAA